VEAYKTTAKRVGKDIALKVKTNEKRDGLNVVSIDRSRFKLYSL